MKPNRLFTLFGFFIFMREKFPEMGLTAKKFQRNSVLSTKLNGIKVTLSLK